MRLRLVEQVTAEPLAVGHAVRRRRVLDRVRHALKQHVVHGRERDVAAVEERGDVRVLAL